MGNKKWESSGVHTADYDDGGVAKIAISNNSLLKLDL